MKTTFKNDKDSNIQSKITSAIIRGKLPLTIQQIVAIMALNYDEGPTTFFNHFLTGGCTADISSEFLTSAYITELFEVHFNEIVDTIKSHDINDGNYECGYEFIENIVHFAFEVTAQQLPKMLDLQISPLKEA